MKKITKEAKGRRGVGTHKEKGTYRCTTSKQDVRTTMKTRRATPIATLLLPLLAACGVPSLMDDGDPNRPDGGSASDGGGGGSATGLPCDVSAVLQKSCAR